MTQPKEGSLRWHAKMLRQVFIEKQEWMEFHSAFGITDHERMQYNDAQLLELNAQRSKRELMDLVAMYGSYYYPIGEPKLEQRGSFQGISTFCWSQRARIR